MSRFLLLSRNQAASGKKHPHGPAWLAGPWESGLPGIQDQVDMRRPGSAVALGRGHFHLALRTSAGPAGRTGWRVEAAQGGMGRGAVQWSPSWGPASGPWRSRGGRNPAGNGLGWAEASVRPLVRASETRWGRCRQTLGDRSALVGGGTSDRPAPSAPPPRPGRVQGHPNTPWSCPHFKASPVCPRLETH